MPADTTWWERAACRGMDTNVFFPPYNERGPSRQRHIERAKLICGQCPVWRECLHYATSTDTKDGVWGGAMLG